jgi:hypothetical protein
MSSLYMGYSGVDITLAKLVSCLQVGLVNLLSLSWILLGWMKTKLCARNLNLLIFFASLALMLLFFDMDLPAYSSLLAPLTCFLLID